MTLEQKADIEILLRLFKDEHVDECEFMSLLDYIVEKKELVIPKTLGEPAKINPSPYIKPL